MPRSKPLSKTPSEAMPAPAVSVIMPLYNHAKYVGMAIDSILQQTFQDFELIVVDDGSTDDGAAVVKKYIKQDKRIRLHQQANGGFGMACNQGLRLARGRYVVWQDADDFSHPEKLIWQYELLEKNKDIGGVNVSYDAIDGENNFPHTPHMNIEKYKKQKINPRDMNLSYDDRRFLINIKKTFHLFYGNTMFRRSCYDMVGWHRNIKACGDRDMFWRLQEKFQIAILTNSIVSPHLVRTHQQQTTKRTKNKIFGKIKIGLGHMLITLSCYTRRLYGRDPLDKIGVATPVARWRHVLYFLPYPRVWYYYFKNKLAAR